MPLDPKKLEELTALATILLYPASIPDAIRRGEEPTLNRAEQRAALLLAQGFPALIAEVERLRELLREVEWVDTGRRSMDVGTGLRTVPDLECPVCGGMKPPGGSHDAWYGHEDDCRLAAALAAAP